MRKRSVVIILVYTITLFACNTPETSPQSSWTKEHSNPVLVKGTPPAYDFINAADCCVLFDQGEYKMWYTAGGAVYPDTVLHNSIALATSPDGIHWTKYANNPVLDVSTSAWDSLGIETVSLLIDEAAPEAYRYKLWYAGQTLNSYRYEIGYAYSSDGIHWTKHPDAILTVGGSGSWDNCFLEGPTVIKENNVYKMWYTAVDCEVNGQATDGKANIGYATSDDGVNWTKYGGNPVLTTTPNSWDAVTVQDPCVIKYDNKYHIWYGGVDVEGNYLQQTGYAVSDDGIHWTKSTHNPILKRGALGAWDGNTASFPSILIHDGKIKMWYTGKDVHPLPAWPAHYYWEIGYAEKPLPASGPLD